MKFFAKFLNRWRKRPSKTPMPPVLQGIVAKINAPSYPDITTAEAMRADFATCDKMRYWVRANCSEEAHLKYIRALNSFESLIESRATLEKLYENQRNAEARLDASYAAQGRLN